MRLRLLLVCAISCLASVWFAPAALAFGDCGDAAYMQTFDDRLRAGSCDVIGVVDIRWSGGSAHMRLIKEHSSTIGSAAALMEQVRELAGRVGSAMDQIGGLSIPDVTVLLTDLMPPAREDAHADIQRTPKLERECAVAFYKSRTGMSRDQFVFTYAHELFHCIQFKMFLAKMVGHSDNWWTEGTAEYFAYLARPGYSGDDSFISQFDAESDAQSLHTMEYETIAFFAWWGQAHAPSAIRSFMAGMSDRNAVSAQLAALQGAVSSDEWLTFEKAYLDKTIHLPGGRLLPSSPRPGATLTIASNQVFPVPSVPYVVARQILFFKRGHVYRIAYSDRPSDARMQWAKAPGGGWEAPPSRVPTCDADVKYRVVWGTTRSESAGTMNVTALPPDAAACNCLVGSWEITSVSLLQNVKEVVCKRMDSCQVVSGGLRLVFNDDVQPSRPGTGLYIYDHLRIDGTLKDAAGSFQKTLDGTAHTTWHTVGQPPRREGSGSLPPESQPGSVLFLGFSDLFHPVGNIHTVTRTRVRHYPNDRGEDGVTSPFVKDEPLQAGVGLGPFLGGRYQCSANSLHIGPPPGYGLEPYSFDFIRSGTEH